MLGSRVKSTQCVRAAILGPGPTRFAQVRNECLPSTTRASRDGCGNTGWTFRRRFMLLVCFCAVFHRFPSEPLIRLNRSFRTCVAAVGLDRRISRGTPDRKRVTIQGCARGSTDPPVEPEDDVLGRPAGKHECFWQPTARLVAGERRGLKPRDPMWSPTCCPKRSCSTSMTR